MSLRNRRTSVGGLSPNNKPQQQQQQQQYDYGYPDPGYQANPTGRSLKPQSSSNSGLMIGGAEDADPATKKKLAQQEYYRQLQEDARRNPIASPRSTISARRRQSPPVSPVTVDRPSGLFAAGIHSSMSRLNSLHPLIYY